MTSLHLLLVVLCTGWLQTKPLDDRAEARKKYDVLSARVIAGDYSIDWRELRVLAVVAGVNGGFDWHEADQRSQAALKAGDYAEALKQARAITSHNIASVKGHFDTFAVYDETKMPP